MSTRNDEDLVYSTEEGWVGSKNSKTRGKNTGKKKSAPLPPSDGIVRVGRETKGRKGKGVTLIFGLPLQGEALKTLGKRLKQKCGTGGTIKDGIIEIQGDHRDLLIKELQSLGHTVKRSGG